MFILHRLLHNIVHVATVPGADPDTFKSRGASRGSYEKGVARTLFDLFCHFYTYENDTFYGQPLALSPGSATVQCNTRNVIKYQRISSYLDLHLEIDGKGKLLTKLYDKHDDFSFLFI